MLSTYLSRLGYYEANTVREQEAELLLLQAGQYAYLVMFVKHSGRGKAPLSLLNEKTISTDFLNQDTINRPYFYKDSKRNVRKYHYCCRCLEGPFKDEERDVYFISNHSQDYCTMCCKTLFPKEFWEDKDLRYKPKDPTQKEKYLEYKQKGPIQEEKDLKYKEPIQEEEDLKYKEPIQEEKPTQEKPSKKEEPKPTQKKAEVKPGQIWEDLDKRRRGRKLTVEDMDFDYIICSTVTGKNTRIGRKRFDAGRFQLITDSTSNSQEN